MSQTSSQRPAPPQPEQQQREVPGRESPMQPKPDHGEQTYRGSGRLAGKRAVITGADSGIGSAFDTDARLELLTLHERTRDWHKAIEIAAALEGAPGDASQRDKTSTAALLDPRFWH